MPCNVDVRWSKCDLKIPLVWTMTIAFTLQTSTRERKKMSDMLCFYIHLVNAVVSVIDVGGSNVIWRYHRTELRSSQSNSKYGYEGLQENVWYVLCHINLVNAVISVIDVGSSNEVWRYHRSEVWPSHSDVGGSNEIWRYHRSELRPLHSDSKYSCEGSKRISDMFLCHIHVLNAAISVIVALGYSPNQRCLKYDRCRVTLMSVVQTRSGDTIHTIGLN
jgi:hypothetical protein